MVTVKLYNIAQKINFKVDFPTTWDDLSDAELHYISKTLFTQAAETAHLTRPQIAMFILAQRIPAAKEILPLLDPEEVAIDLLPMLDFLFKENDRTIAPEPFRIDSTSYHPQPWHEITCAEYEDAEVRATKYLVEPADETLAELAAILFRPLLGDKLTPYQTFDPSRNEYTTYKHQQKAPIFKTLSPEILYSIFIWYSGSRAMLPKLFPTVYEGEGEAGAQPDLMVFTKCIHAGAGPKNGSREKIRATKLYEFLFEMEQEAIRVKEMNRRMEEAARK